MNFPLPQTELVHVITVLITPNKEKFTFYMIYRLCMNKHILSFTDKEMYSITDKSADAAHCRYMAINV